ncbi:GLPGLI family protein [Gelatiniphilus marinus]|uniref:GLPGLI family protein n=1 Tax=Gelatiniphilus marinus TaxID=1759464 RepID=A0ABW5JTF9_9FLAO
MNLKSIFIALIISCFSAQSQSAVITYEVSNVTENSTDRIKKLKEELQLMEFTLQYNKINSYFKKERNIPKHKFINKIATIIIGAPSDFYQNLALKKSSYNTTINNKLYEIDHNYKMKGWELTTESVIIEKYTCYKAILKEYNNRTESYFETVAWYTPDIPVGFGPIGYGGLPGLILQLQYKKSIFTATKIVLNPTKVKIEKPKQGKKISVGEQVKLMRSARKVTPD